MEANFKGCISYFGSYELNLEENLIVHHVEGALFPNWSDTLQRRPFVLDGNELSLQGVDDDGRLTNEMVWMQKGLDY